MKQEVTEVVINGITYVPKDSFNKMADKREGMKYVIVRTYSAGVFAGYIESQEGSEVVMRDARRIYYWAGAATLSQLATDGTAKPEECKFPCIVDRVKLLQVIEIIECTAKAKESIGSVPIWEL